MNKILVTGSEGFIGKHIVNRLLSEGHTVYGISRRPVSDNSHPDYLYESIDILDRDKLQGFLRGLELDAVIHLASLTTHDELMNFKEQTLRINLEGALNLLDEFKHSKAVKFIFISTGKVYGEIQELPISENHPAEPSNILGKSKLITEKLIDFYAYETDRQYTILRVFNVYGPGQRDYFLIPTILSQLTNGNTDITLGNIHDRRDYIFIDDVIEALITVIDNDLPLGVNVFNVGSGEPHSASDMVSTIEKLLEKKITINTDKSKFRKDEFPEEYADIKELSSYGWYPKSDLIAGLKKTIPFYLTS